MLVDHVKSELWNVYIVESTSKDQSVFVNGCDCCVCCCVVSDRHQPSERISIESCEWVCEWQETLCECEWVCVCVCVCVSVSVIVSMWFYCELSLITCCVIQTHITSIQHSFTSTFFLSFFSSSSSFFSFSSSFLFLSLPLLHIPLYLLVLFFCFISSSSFSFLFLYFCLLHLFIFSLYFPLSSLLLILLIFVFHSFPLSHFLHLPLSYYISSFTSFFHFLFHFFITLLKIKVLKRLFTAMPEEPFLVPQRTIQSKIL